MTTTAWIVNFRSSAHLANCLVAIDPWVDRVLILENGSGADEQARLSALAARSQKVSVIISEENLGFGAGMNLLSRADRSDDLDFVWLVNPDIVEVFGSPDRLRELLASGFAEIGSPKLVTSSVPRRVLYAGGELDLRRGVVRHNHFGEYLDESHGSDVMITTSFMTGAAPLMLRSTWDRLGGFDETLFLYWEDVALSVRAAEIGLRMVVDPRFQAAHLTGASSHDLKPGKSTTHYFYTRRNRVVVSGRYHSPIAVVLGPGLTQTLRLVLRPLTNERHDRIEKLIAAVRGTAVGLVATNRARRGRRQGPGRNIDPKGARK